MADNPRLSNLGVTTPSKAGVAAESPLAPDKLTALLEGTIGLDKRLAEARAAETPSTADNLFSKRSVPPLVLAALAAMLGGEGGQAAAAGVLSGTMQGASAKATNQAAKQKAGIDALQDVVDKRRTTLTTLLTSQPGLFTDSEGKDAVDPAVLGMATTGVPIALSPSSILAERRRTAAQEARLGFWSDTLKNATTPEVAMQAARQVSNVLGLDMTPEDLTTLSTLDETGFWTNLADNSTMDTGSVLSAWLYSIQNGKNRFDPDVIGKLHPSVKGKGEITIDDVAIGYLQKWQDAVDENPALAKLPPDQQLATVFAGEPAAIAVLNSKFKTTEGEPTYLDAGALKDAFVNTNNMVNSLYLLAPEAANKLFGSKEQAAKVLGDITRSQLAELNRELAGRHAGKVGTVYTQFETAYADQHPDATPSEVQARALALFAAAVESAGGDPKAPDFDIETLRAEANKLIKIGLPR